MKERCENCRFWKRVEAGNMYPGDETWKEIDDNGELKIVCGTCQRFPPLIDFEGKRIRGREYMKRTGFGNDGAPLTSTSVSQHFPVTYDDEWCGEFKPKEGSP